MTEELKPCPFCGGTPKLILGGMEILVFCKKCGSQTDFYESVPMAVEAWNARADNEVNYEPPNYSYHACESGTDEEIHRLRETLKACCNEFYRESWLCSRPPCNRNGLVVDEDRRCSMRKFCRVYAEIVKGSGK